MAVELSHKEVSGSVLIGHLQWVKFNTSGNFLLKIST